VEEVVEEEGLIELMLKERKILWYSQSWKWKSLRALRFIPFELFQGNFMPTT
jgi:hypothetical protein